jgi:CRP/FNR family transcriptional regulator, cyclic AMP receptor protein
MARKDMKIEAIKHVPLFATLSKRELAAVAAIADEIDLADGKELIREGDRGREFFVLLEGSADVRKGNRKIRSLGDGDFFGEIALVAHTPRTATVVARSPIRALVITDRAFKSLLEKMPEVQAKVLQALAERLAPAVF